VERHVYYEGWWLERAFVGSYRDEYLTLVPATNAPTIQDAEGTNETLNIDFSASYEINEHLTILSRDSISPTKRTTSSSIR
jgi:hypothetical protein